MKVLILAGGYGSRLGPLTSTTPKPMVKIANRPIIWHIMKYYSCYGLNDFIILSGYKSKVIENYFSKKKKIFLTKNKRWKVKVINTGKNTMTGGRLKRVKNLLKEDFCLTYGDGLSNLNIKNQIQFHKKNKKMATILAVRPPTRFGLLNIKKNMVKKFEEKPKNSSNTGWINGGFFILSKEVIKFIKNDKTILEREPMEKLSSSKNLMAYKHDGFWQPMDTIREKEILNQLWEKGLAPWKIWND